MANPACYVNGIMNAVEIDVGNLQKWIQGIGPGASGPLVENTSQNGYLLYFSDRRGMLPDPNAVPVANVTTGEYGFEDVVNSNSVTGTPDGNLEPLSYYAFFSRRRRPERTERQLGRPTRGLGFWAQAAAATTANNPYQSVNCLNVGRQNAVTGARHVLRLIDGGLNNLPYPGAASWGVGGFTVASENPVYIWGKLQFRCHRSLLEQYHHRLSHHYERRQPFCCVSSLADSTVTLLSNAWSDLNDMNNTLNLVGPGPEPIPITDWRLRAEKILTSRNPITVQRRATISVPMVAYTTSCAISKTGGGVTLSYRGSLVSLNYSQYATGTFKCCNLSCMARPTVTTTSTPRSWIRRSCLQALRCCRT